MKITLKDLSPSLWKDLETLFGENGACGGCWCMTWRHPKGEKWETVKGAKNKERFKKLVVGGKAHGALAYVDGEPAGWVSYDRRQDFSKLDRAPSLKCDDADQVWSIPCFYIKAKFRNQGLATELLKFALKGIKRLGGEIAEGYPVRAQKKGQQIPAAFAWTGTLSLFDAVGFKPVGKRDGGKQRMRRPL